MKSLFIRLASFVLFCSVLTVAVSAAEIYLSEGSSIYQSESSKNSGSDVIEKWAESSPYSLRFFNDREKTDRITDICEIEVGQDIYYEVVTDEGYYLKTFYTTCFYLDSERFTIKNFFSPECDVVLAGDFTDDSTVNVLDALYILRHLENSNAGFEPDTEAGDYNRDGVLDSADAEEIVKMLAGWGNIHGGVQSGFETMSFPDPTVLS